MPRVAKLNVTRDEWRVTGDFATRAKGAEREKGIGRDKGIPCLRRIKRTAAEQNNAGFTLQLPDERFGGVRGLDFVDQRTHLKISRKRLGRDGGRAHTTFVIW